MREKINLFSPQSAADRSSNAWRTDSVGEPDTSPRPQSRLYLAAAVAGLMILAIFAYPAQAANVTLVAIVAIVLPWGLYYTSRDVSRLLIVLILIEAATASTWVVTAGTDLGALIRCPLEFLFCLPIFLPVWRSGILRQGGFRDYKFYLLAALASAAYSIAPEASAARAMAAILPFIAICAIAEKVHSPEDARRVMGVLLAACGLIVAINFLALILFPASTSWHLDEETGMLRFSGIFTEPNEIGGLAIATITAGFGYWSIAKGSRRILSAAAMIGAALLAMLADSRSPLAAIALSVAVYAIWRYRFKGALAIAALYLIVHLAFASIPGMQSYVNRGDVSSFTGREVAWNFAVRSIKEHPVIGSGYGIEGQILQSPYFASWDEVWSQGYHSSLHNGYLSRAVSLGIPTLVFWLFLILRPIVTAFLPKRDIFSLQSIALLSILPVLIMNVTESISDFGSFAGVEMAVIWMLLERQRLLSQPNITDHTDHMDVSPASDSGWVRALRA
jgi:O-antigen ligase